MTSTGGGSTLFFPRRRNSIRQQPRPLTNVKVYGGEYMRFGGPTDGIERFWRNIFGGHAAVRFHRPSGGIGLSPKAQRTIRSAREVTNAFGVFRCEPRNDLLADRGPNEAYYLAEAGKLYAVHFPTEGAVSLHVSRARGELSVRWHDVDRGQWRPAESVPAGSRIALETPGSGQWAAVVLAR